MNIRKIVALAGLALSTLPALASGASAQMYNGNSTFKVERNGQAIVYIGELSPSADVPVTFVGADRTRRVSANACGLIILRSSPAAPLSGLKLVDGMTINQAQFSFTDCNQGKRSRQVAISLRLDLSPQMLVAYSPFDALKLKQLDGFE